MSKIVESDDVQFEPVKIEPDSLLPKEQTIGDAVEDVPVDYRQCLKEAVDYFTGHDLLVAVNPYPWGEVVDTVRIKVQGPRIGLERQMAILGSMARYPNSVRMESFPYMGRDGLRYCVNYFGKYDDLEKGAVHVYSVSQGAFQMEISLVQGSGV